ncbi:MAG TPA: CPP1-like family protein [Trichocoleus sp.]
MSDQNSNVYETLGLTEASSFEEIQEARNRLVEEHAGDRKHLEEIEAAYDAILMERLRLRQEGKIKVPDRIRFAENVSEPAPSVPVPVQVSRPNWLGDLIDTPSREDVLWPSIAFLGLALFGFYTPSLALALGVGCAIYFLNRKENKFWRSVLLTVAGLFAGFALALVVVQLLLPQVPQLAPLPPEAITAALTSLVLWALSSFLR